MRPWRRACATSCLRGADAFVEGQRSTTFRRWPGLLASRPGAPANVLRDVIAAGGLKRMVPGPTRRTKHRLAALTQTLQDRFAHLSPLQGLRFRSSSTAEDATGFNGAGL